MRTRTILVGLGLVLVAGLRADTVVFADGRALLPVIVAAEANADERAAAEELARVLGAMSGVEWPIRTEAVGQGAGFFVGRTRAAAKALLVLRPARDLLAPRSGEIGPDGFRIRTVGERVFVEGATPEATANAVAWLLERQGGVRWYAPGAVGEVIPRRDAWTLPDLAVVREPAYVSREISGSGTAEWVDWCRRNGLRGRLEYSHHLDKIFTPELYDAHPDWFGTVRGERRRPRGGGDYHWQPDLSRSDVAEYAAAQAAAALAREPGRASFSLGMNDTVRFDQGDGTRAAVEPLRYFRGMPDYSPLLFGFMNRAATALRRHEGLDNRYLGCLAYFWGENPPPFAVDARVVPYVTTDRTQFYDPEYRAADYELMSCWSRSGVRAYGLWEYAYGNAFVVPRQANRAIAEAIHEGWWRGARGYIADTGPHAGFDSFKVWMMAKLLWEPDRPVAELEDDFFTGWYGPAAEPMRRFFRRCEEVWMAQEGPPWWIKYYQQADQVRLFSPEVCRELRGLLEEAAAMAERGERNAGAEPDVGSPLAGGPSGSNAVRTQGPTLQPAPQHAARVALTSRAFAVSEAAVVHEALRSELAADSASALGPAELGDRLSALLRARGELQRALQEAADTGALCTANGGYLLRNDPVPRLLAVLGRKDRVAPLTALAEATIAGATVPAHWTALAAAYSDGRIRRAENLVQNGSFATTVPGGHAPRFLYPKSGEIPAGWELHAAPTEQGRVALGTPVLGTRTLRIEGAWDTQLNQAHEAQPGCLHVAEALLRGRSSPGNDVALTLAFVDAGGALVGEYRTVALPKGESAWRTVTLADMAPRQAKYVVVGVTVTRQFGGDWAEVAGITLRAVQTTED